MARCVRDGGIFALTINEETNSIGFFIAGQQQRSIGFSLLGHTFSNNSCVDLAMVGHTFLHKSCPDIIMPGRT